MQQDIFLVCSLDKKVCSPFSAMCPIHLIFWNLTARRMLRVSDFYLYCYHYGECPVFCSGILWIV